MSQVYAATGDCPATTVITAIPSDSIGTQGITLLGPTGGLDFNYKNQISNLTAAGVPQVGTASSGNMFAEFQDFITKWVRNQTTPNGISPTSDAAGNTVTGGNPYASVGPREVVFRIKLMCDAMLTQSNG